MDTNIMGLSVPRLRRWRAGLLTLDHRQMNEPLDLLDNMTRGVGVPRQVHGQGRPSTEAGSLVARFKLTQSAADFPDHLVCRTWDGTTEGETNILVAKPWELRQTSYGGQTEDGVTYQYATPILRTASKPHPSIPGRTISEEQMILPPYVVNGALFAESPIERGTGVTLGDGTPVVWLAQDTARAWTGIFE